MRRLILALAVLGCAPSAFAADYGAPYLRGSQIYDPGVPSFANWAGAYIGGQAGYSHGRTNFDVGWGSMVPLAAAQAGIPAGLALGLEPFGKGSGSGASYGAFLGFNSQWDEVVLGLELNYNHTSLRSSISEMIVDGSVAPFDTATITATREVHVTDYGTFRARAGYIMGRFLPYAMIGFAVGRVEEVRSATVSPVLGGVAFPSGMVSDTQSKWAYGYAAGVGIDVMIAQNIMLRGEYEFVQFVDHLNTSINTVRGGLAFRF
jgi:opacity protein-like surface antigen